MAIISIILISSTHHDAGCVLQTAAHAQMLHAPQWARGKMRALRGGEGVRGWGREGAEVWGKGGQTSLETA